MKKILLISDSPYASTGLGRMSKYFLKMLPDYEWSIWGILHPDFNIRKGNYLPYYDPKEFPDTKFKLLAPKSYTDEQYGFEFIQDFIKSEEPDFVITSMDMHLSFTLTQMIKDLQFTMDKKFKWINYFPMDREDFKRLEIDAFRFADVNVCITKFGVDKIHSYNPKVRIEQIYHPLDLAEFPEVDSEKLIEFRHKAWKNLADDAYQVGTVNRSFARKDTARLVRCFVEFLKKTKDTAVYIHGNARTIEGIDLVKMSMENEAPKNRMAYLPAHYSEVDGVNQETLNMIYRSFNQFVTVSTGEGFGFSTVEALACKVPIIAPYNTSFPELIGDNGYLVKPSEMTFLNNKSTTMWPIVNIDAVVERMLYVYEHPEEAKERAEGGYKWVKDNLNLEKIANQWREILK